MPGGNDYGEPKTAQHRRGAQAVLNASWPLVTRPAVTLAASRTSRTPIDVEVRVEWAQDGEEWLAGRA